MGQVKKISFIDDGAHTTFVSGVFNILHPGHRRFLDFAASKKKHLVIGVFSDSFAGEKAYMPEEVRLAAVRAYSKKARVFLINDNLKKVLSNLKPSLIIKGPEFRDADNIEKIVKSWGGRATGLTNAVWAPNRNTASEILRGMSEASKAYRIPIVGGHTNFNTDRPQLAATIFGKAESLITSFEAKPGDALIAATDQRGSYVGASKNFAAFLQVPGERLRKDCELLPSMAERGLFTAGKDISQGGIVGTALMLAECSKVGIEIDLESIKSPDGELEKWLGAFPSYGFLLAARPDKSESITSVFHSREIDARVIGQVVEGTSLHLFCKGERHLVWNHSTEPYLGL